MARPKASVARDALLQLRTFGDLVERLDAMTLVRRRPSRASLLEYYLMHAVEADERELGLVSAAAPSSLTVEPLPSLDTLAPSIRGAVLAKYRKVGRIAKARTTSPKG